MLRASMQDCRAQFLAVFDCGAVGVVVSGDAYITISNRKFQEMLGYTAEELQSANVSKITHPDDWQAEQEPVRELIAGKRRFYQTEKRYIHKDGSILWGRTTATAVTDALGRVVCLVCVIEDISERNRAEEAVREVEERWKSVLESVGHGAWDANLQTDVVVYSPHWKKMLGFEEHEIGDCIDECRKRIHPEDWERTRGEVQRLLSGATDTIEFQFRLQCKDGSYKWVLCRGKTVARDEDGKPLRVIGTHTDLTDQKRAEEDYNLQHMFLNNITHEIRTPLTAVQGYASMLLEGAAGPVSAEQSALLRKIVSSSESLIQAMGCVLEVARLRSGETALRLMACSPRQILEDAVSVVTPMARKKGLTVNVSCSLSGHTGIYDQDKLAAVFRNLLTNAVKFTESGGVRVELGRTAGGFEVTVVDTGIGIAQANLERIFDEFSQFDYPGKHKPDGFGVGLTIVATIVEAIGASLTVSSKEEVGTAFTLNVPEFK